MTSFWNRPVWYVAVLRCVVGGIVGTGMFFAGSLITFVGGALMNSLPYEEYYGPPPSLLFALKEMGSELLILGFCVGCVVLWIRLTMLSGKVSAAIAYRGQGRVRFVPKLILTFLAMWSTWMGLMVIADVFLSETPNWESDIESLAVIGLFYWCFYFISLLVYHYVELARETPVEES